MSYAAYRLLQHRFKDSPDAAAILRRFNLLMENLGYDFTYTATDYANGPPAALGNYISEQLIQYGLLDGANEANAYQNVSYQPLNPLLNPNATVTAIKDPNRWQPLGMDIIIDQGGRPLNTPPPFLSPEWGKVIPFALKQEDLSIYRRKGFDYWVYNDPGSPPKVDVEKGGGTSADYLWNFALVSI